ncbi:MAG: hypothetical protein AB7H86_01030 [Blastocatellales bacterium]
MKNRTKTILSGLIISGFLVAGSLGVVAQGGGQSKGKRPAQQQQKGGMEKGRTVTKQQRDQLQTCTTAADRLRDQTREMAKLAGGGFRMEDGLKLRDQLRDQLRTMDREHERLMQGLSQEQKMIWRERIRTMDQERTRVQDRFREMNQEFGKPNPDPAMIRKQAQEMERAVNEWRKQYREMNLG